MNDGENDETPPRGGVLTVRCTSKDFKTGAFTVAAGVALQPLPTAPAVDHVGPAWQPGVRGGERPWQQQRRAHVR